MTASRSKLPALLLPYGLLIAVFLVLPAAGLFEISFRHRSTLSITGEAFSAENYTRLFDAYYLGILWQTIKLAFVATSIEIVFGFPVAYMLARSRGIWRTTLTCLVMIPLMTSVIVKVFGWYILLGNDGLIVAALRLMGLDVASLLSTEAAVIIGLAEFALPFMIFSLASSIERIPTYLEEAASNLGASPAMVFLKVIVPMSRPGLLSGFLLCFGVSSSAYVVPTILGGITVKMVAQQIYDDVLVAFNWPGAAALSVVLLLLLGSILYAALVTARRQVR